MKEAIQKLYDTAQESINRRQNPYNTPRDILLHAVDRLRETMHKYVPHSSFAPSPSNIPMITTQEVLDDLQRVDQTLEDLHKKCSDLHITNTNSQTTNVGTELLNRFQEHLSNLDLDMVYRAGWRSNNGDRKYLLVGSRLDCGADANTLQRLQPV